MGAVAGMGTAPSAAEWNCVTREAAAKVRAMSRRPPLSAFLRLILMVMLALGSCLQPALAAACDIEDARIALDGGAAGAVMVAADAGHADGAGDCCANPACGDCCLHAAATLPASPQAMAFALPPVVGAPLRIARAASVYPVDSRPPIAG